MTIACVAGAESEQRARSSRGMERARPLTRTLFQAYFTFTKIVIGQNYLIFLLNNLPFRDCLYRWRKIETLSNATHAQLTRRLWLHGLVEMHCFLRNRLLELLKNSDPFMNSTLAKCRHLHLNTVKRRNILSTFWLLFSFRTISHSRTI